MPVVEYAEEYDACMRYTLLNFIDRSSILRHKYMPKKLFTKSRHACDKVRRNKQRVTMLATLIVTLARVVLSPSVS
jgi:hypothetical protein